MPVFPIQETLAHAVAQEMHKVYKKELGPQPVPLTVPGEAVDEEEVSVFCSFHVLIIMDLNLPQVWSFMYMS